MHTLRGAVRLYTGTRFESQDPKAWTAERRVSSVHVPRRRAVAASMSGKPSMDDLETSLL